MTRTASNVSMCNSVRREKHFLRKLGLFAVVSVVTFSILFGPILPSEGGPAVAHAQNLGEEAINLQGAVDEIGCVDFTEFSLGNCVVVASYYLFVWPPAMIAGLTGIVFDVSFSLNIKNFGLTETFVEDTWGVSRDIANLFFIFILLYAGIATILSLTNIDTKRIIVLVILIAILVNFSLFFTRVVVDVGNGLAAVFYNAVTSTGAGTTVSSISAALMSFFGPQKLLAQDLFNHISETQKLLFVPVFMAFGIIALAMAWVFISVAVLMFVRIAVLMFLMITAPIAFVAFVIPKTRSLVSDKWWGELVGKSFFPAIFLFFIFIIFSAGETFFQSTTTLLPGDTSGAIGTIVMVLVQGILLVAMLVIAKNVTVGASGMFGKSAASFGQKALGLAVGGAGGFALRNVVGRGARAVAQSEGMQRFAAKSAAGESALRFMQTAGRSSYDLRGIAPEAAGVGKPSGKGGYEKASKEREKRMVKFGKDLKGTVQVKTGEKDEEGRPQYKTISATEAYQQRLEKTAPPLGRFGGNIITQLASGNTGAQYRGAAKELGKEVKKKRREEMAEKELEALEKTHWGDGESKGKIGEFVENEEVQKNYPELKTINLDSAEGRSKATQAYEEEKKKELQRRKSAYDAAMAQIQGARDTTERGGAERRLQEANEKLIATQKEIDEMKGMKRLSEVVDKKKDEKKDKGEDKGDKKE